MKGAAAASASLRCQLLLAPRVPTGWMAIRCSAGPTASPVVAPASTRSLPAVPRSDARGTPGAYSLTLGSPSAIDLRRHKKAFVHLLNTGMAHTSLHTMWWRSAVNKAPRPVTCFDIVTEALRSYCGAHMRAYAALRATTYWPAQGFAAPI